MRRARWLLLAAISVLVIALSSTYYGRLELLRKEAPAPPKPLKKGVDIGAKDWEYRKSDEGRPLVYIRARGFQEIKTPPHMELEGVELHLFHKDGQQYDRVTSKSASFSKDSSELYSDGDVEIVMGIPVEGPPQGRLVKIDTSGVHFDTKTGKATTDRPAKFEFDRGDGSSVGAEYDPSTRELHLKGQVLLHWRGKEPESAPMTIEAGEALYKELESKVILFPWSKLTRDTLHVEAAMSVVTLEDGVIRLAEVQSARGTRDDPPRKVEFAADQLTLHFADELRVSKITGERNAQLVSIAPTAQTKVTSDRIDLDFDTSSKDGVLTNALAMGHAVAESQPVARPGVQLAETRILGSEAIRLKMRPNGEEIQSVETDAPAAVEFRPNRAGQPRRFLNGERVWITYAADNHIESFRSVNVSTRTENPPKEAPAKSGQPAAPNPPVLTWSKNLRARFDPKTSQMTEMEQWTNFRYEAGDRKARADRAILDEPKDQITLIGSARVSDQTGSASADRIVLDQKTGDVTAEGNVASMRLPDKKGSSSAMLSNNEVMQARARKMTSTDNNLRIVYEGKAVAWQGANRLEADRIEIDRDDEILSAHGHVRSQFVDRPKQQDGKTEPKTTRKTRPAKADPPPASVFTIVSAADLVYSEETHLARYTGGVALKRPGLTVKAREIRAFLKDANADSSLDKAYADGGVEIYQSSLQRSRTGFGEHAEYYTANDKVVLNGGSPKLIDSVKGTTEGRELTWFYNDDRLLVDGVESQPAKSLIRRK